ncbi:MAG: bi-domain-containing oxidoreductase [Planctomycetota bacterium]|nr:bi-domain-containing oxidoreductase [Planctomycetota bacterium]
MRQVVLNYNSGEVRLEDVPAPICRSGGVVVRTAFSLVSAGTERMKVSQAKMSLLEKARARPDKVKQVIQSVRQKGLMETYNLVRERLSALTPIGYSLAGVVEEVGSGLDEFAVGDRVACAGEGIASHAEFVFVPRNLCVPVPEGVDLKDAAFTTVGAIALQGVRQSGVTLGETVLVIGLGLVGLLGVQILKAAGCRVIGVDVDPKRTEQAKHCGADAALVRDNTALEDTVLQMTQGRGPDVAYIAASTSSKDPMELAGQLVRDRGKVTIVGMVPVEADWRTYYSKELSVVMSRSYGPGRYDRNYEMKGISYPVGYVRWTERDNMAEFLRLIAAGLVMPSRLAPQVHPLAEAATVYGQVLKSSTDSTAAMLFEYPADAPVSRKVVLPAQTRSKAVTGPVGIGLIGAGHFATGTLIPALKRLARVRLRGVCSAGGLTAKNAAARHGFEYCASDYHELLADPDIHAVVIATRHDTHARFTAEAARAGKHVFVEKPLALTREQLEEVTAAQAETGRIIMPGFNRRFSPLSVAVRDFFTGRSSPIEVIARVNAGTLKADSWYQDPEEGGWRIVSEGCHFVDLIQFICGCPPVQVFAEMVGGDIPGKQNDNCAVTLKMEDGSLGVLLYLANGDPQFEKERIEVFGQQRTAVIENWHVARLSGDGRTRKVRARGSGKGHADEMNAFVEAVASGAESPLPFGEAAACTAATLAITESLTSRESTGIEGRQRLADPDASSAAPG